MKTIVGLFWSVMAGFALAFAVIFFTQLLGAGAVTTGALQLRPAGNAHDSGIKVAWPAAASLAHLMPFGCQAAPAGSASGGISTSSPASTNRTSQSTHSRRPLKPGFPHTFSLQLGHVYLRLFFGSSTGVAG